MYGFKKATFNKKFKKLKKGLRKGKEMADEKMPCFFPTNENKIEF